MHSARVAWEPHGEHDRAMAETERVTRRSSFRKSLAETALPHEYLEQLEEKRKQLDESIHKYIAAKERDYKQFERDLRHQHREAQGQEGAANGSVKRRSSSESNADRNAVSGPQRTPTPDAVLVNKRPSNVHADDEEEHQQTRSTIAGLKDRRASHEREKDFIGLFTPPYLPMLDDRETRSPENPPSDSAATQEPSQATPEQNSGANDRSGLDPNARAKPKRPSQLLLAHRTSSSGSSADGKPASAMKTTRQEPKRKRVSLAVGDEIVAPTDNVPDTLDRGSTPSHSRIRSVGGDKASAGSAAEGSDPGEDENSSIEPSMAAEGSLLDDVAADGSETAKERIPTPSRTTSSRQIGSSKPTPSSSKIDPDGDLFDLEAENDGPIEQGEIDDLDESAVETDDDDDDITGRVEHIEDTNDPHADSSDRDHNSSKDLDSEAEDDAGCPIPNLGSTPTSKVSSRQPIRPGFRRPSVLSDPVYRGADYDAAEHSAVYTEIYGSSYSRPSHKGSFTPGSLGESYMAAHAEEMMKLREARQQAQVKS